MKVVQCARCGHENRAAISLSICDRCGADISTLSGLRPDLTERDLRAIGAEGLHEEAIAAAAADAPPSKPAAQVGPPAPVTPWPRRAAALIARLLLAAAALALGVATGITLTVGSALQADQYIAGSVAILAAATAISGLVMMLAGNSPERSQRITLGLRTLGFVLALTGVWAVTTIAVTSTREEAPNVTGAAFPPEMTMPGPVTGAGMGRNPGAPGPPVAPPMAAPLVPKAAEAPPGARASGGPSRPAPEDGEPPR